MELHKIILNKKELNLLSDICHNYKDDFRGSNKFILPVMRLERKITRQTGGAYFSDTTYDVKKERRPRIKK